jgi:nucleoid-associated protein YgaU
MSRTLLIGLVGGVFVIAAIALTYFIERRPDGKPTMPAVAQAKVAPAPPQTAALPSANAPAPAAAAAPLPSFDVVRVNPRGDAVIAGRAAPHAMVVISDGTTVIGQVRADGRGEWVLVPEKPLPPGTHELTLSAQLENEAPMSSDGKVVLVVPERGKDIAGRPVEEPTGALALIVPGRAGQAPTVLQRPQSDGAAATLTGEASRGGAAALSLDAIDYDRNGEIAMSGRAAPGAKVQVYLNDQPFGVAEADAAGIWRLTPPVDVPEGLYRLRVDRVEGGKVVERIELPFARSVLVADIPADGQVLVQPGNSLWRLARRSYGEGVRYTMIFDANRAHIRNPDLIYPGQVFVLPKIN